MTEQKKQCSWFCVACGGNCTLPSGHKGEHQHNCSFDVAEYERYLASREDVKK